MPRDERDAPANPAQADIPSTDAATAPGGMRLSMHDGVEVWCDCCSCEVEPYWLAAFEDPEPDTD